MCPPSQGEVCDDRLCGHRRTPLAVACPGSSGDWGEVSQQDAAENVFALTHGLQVLSAYALQDGTRIWNLTDADRSATTILLPAEY